MKQTRGPKQKGRHGAENERNQSRGLHTWGTRGKDEGRELSEHTKARKLTWSLSQTNRRTLMGLSADWSLLSVVLSLLWRASATTKLSEQGTRRDSLMPPFQVLSCTADAGSFFFILCEDYNTVRVFYLAQTLWNGAMGLDSPCRAGELLWNRLIHARNKKSGDSHWIKTLLKDVYWCFG